MECAIINRMADRKNKPWRERYLRQLGKYLDASSGETIDARFKEDVESLRSLGDGLESVSNLYAWHREHKPTLFMRKYRLSESLYDFIYHYIKTNEIDVSLIGAGVILVSELDGTAIDGADGDAWTRYMRNKVAFDSTEYYSSELKIVLVSSTVSPNHIMEFLRDGEVKAFMTEKRKLLTDDEKIGRIKQSGNRLRDLAVYHLKKIQVLLTVRWRIS